MKPLDGKIGVCFSGRVHHAEKLSRLMNYLQEHGGLCIRYVTSAFNSYNVDSFERPLKDKGLPYDLIQDWLTADLIDEINHLNQTVQNDITKQMFSEEHNILDTVSTIWTRDAFRDTIECYVLFREYLKAVRPDIVFVLHESNFWTKILSYWAKEMNIPVVSFQEGMYRPPGASQYFQTLYGKILAEYSTKVCLWGDYAKDIFKDCGVPEGKLVTVGAPHLDDLLSVTPEERKNIRDKTRQELGIGDSQKVILMLLSPSRIWQGDLMRDIRLVADYVHHDPNVSLIVKWHPMEHGELIEQVKQALNTVSVELQGGTSATINTSQNDERIIHEHNRDIIHLIWSSDLALIQNSTSGLECLVFGVPLVEINLESKPLPHSYYADGVAECLHYPQEIQQFPRFLNGDRLRVIPGMVDRYLERLLYRLDGNTQKRILDVVTGLLPPA